MCACVCLGSICSSHGCRLYLRLGYSRTRDGDVVFVAGVVRGEG